MHLKSSAVLKGYPGVGGLVLAQNKFDLTFKHINDEAT